MEAGCDIIETNSFGSTPLVLDEYGLGAKAYEISKKSSELAREALRPYDTSKKPRFVAGSVGPTTKALSVTGGVTFRDLITHFAVQIEGLVDGGCDYILIETAQDARNIKAALIAIEDVEKKKKQRILTAVSGTIETMGTMLAGQAVDALLSSLLHKEIFYIGLNCATGPEFMTDHLRTLAKTSPFPVACVPNAGLPDEDGCYLETPSMMQKTLQHFMEQGWVNFVGGCCGTHKGHIHSFSELAEKYPPRKPLSLEKSYLSGIENLEVSEESRPLIVGERTNVIGSKKFKTLISEGRYEEAAEVARAQVKSGAHIIDICLSNPDRNEAHDLEKFMQQVIKVVKVPLMIDSTDEKVIELALEYCQGKSIINSINLEDGEERFEKVVPLAKRFGAALVVGTIDEDPENGMAVTAQRKLEIAERSYNLLVHKYGVSPFDIYFDPLVFPCATGDEKYVGSAKETIEGVRKIKSRFPHCKTVLGISNVSFGLPGEGREVLNSVFLHHCVQAGLDLAIVNSEKLERFASLPAHEIELANNLLFNLGSDPIAAFAAQFRDRVQKAKIDRNTIPLKERLAQNIVSGSKEGLLEDLELALKSDKPLDIINGPLMTGMDEVGRLFNDNKLIVAEVLQSAEVMKAAVAYLEQFMEKSESSSRGKILLATVKGDVHDIGKNLVDIILTNNGYQVINLGIKIPPEKLIEEARKHKPDLIGLSGLLVKSAQQMIVTAEDLKRAQIHTPMLVGGAALTRNFTEKKILPAYGGPVFYASDAMNGLDLANSLRDPERAPDLLAKNLQIKETQLKNSAIEKSEGSEIPTEKIVRTKRSDSIEELSDLPRVPDFQRHVLRNTPVDEILPFINPLMLYTRHLGLKAATAKMLAQLTHPSGGTATLSGTNKNQILRDLESQDSAAFEVYQIVEEFKVSARKGDLFQPSAVFQFFAAQSEGCNLKIYDTLESTKLRAEFQFPRQPREPFLCLSDYVSTKAQRDAVAFFVTTAGRGIRDKAEVLKSRGEYLKSHVLQALALEMAEAYAEYLHFLIRRLWGFPDSPQLTMMERFQAKYRGKRYSFGYPACPRLEDQEILFSLLNPKDIGVELTEGFMMDPEASVSALVFHHPKATYYSVNEKD